MEFFLRFVLPVIGVIVFSSGAFLAGQRQAVVKSTKLFTAAIGRFARYAGLPETETLKLYSLMGICISETSLELICKKEVPLDPRFVIKPVAEKGDK